MKQHTWIPENFKRFTQFDMFWVALLQELADRKEVRQHLKFYPNNSIYELIFLSLCRIQICKDKREHSISALRKSIVLDHLLTHVKWGSTVQMVSIDDDSEKKKALNTLIN
jgi:hypothetical protein